MGGKYGPLTDHLRSVSANDEVAIQLRVLDQMVGGLPPSSASAEWWANTAGHSQALAWLSVGRRARVDLLAGQVVFSAAGAPVTRTPSGPITSRVPAVMDGVKALDAVLRRAGYASVAAAVAEHTLFLDPKTR
jgi:hypothetical protein